MTLNSEVLNPIPGFDGYYASNIGNIYSSWKIGANKSCIDSKQRKRISPATTIKGYKYVHIRVKKNKYIMTGVHRLVCLAFYGVPNDRMTASHLNGVSGDNRVENLAWETQSDNCKRKSLHPRYDGGHRNSRAKFTKDEVADVRKMLRDGYAGKFIAEKYSVSRALITLIKQGKRYKL